MHSCIYEGRVTHQRFRPVTHQFQYRLFMVYLDLAEMPATLRSAGISHRRWAAASFVRDDHLKANAGSLEEAARELVESETGRRPSGPIRLLTQLRHFGQYFSPLNLFFCFDSAGEKVEFVVAEVNNTPWREQHCYVLWEGNRTTPADDLRFVHEKSFHVSPFMDMDADYDWQLSKPAASLDVQVTNTHSGQPLFSAELAMKRRPLTRWQLTLATIRTPWIPVKILVAIYFQALRLWMKKCPFYPHPSKRQATAPLRPKSARSVEKGGVPAQ